MTFNAAFLMAQSASAIRAHPHNIDLLIKISGLQLIVMGMFHGFMVLIQSKRCQDGKMANGCLII